MRNSKKQHKTEKTNMDKWRIKIAMKVLDDVKEDFPETKEFLDGCIQQECLKENITVEEVIFLFTYLEAKS